MRKLLATLTVIAALFAVALPAQAAPYQRTNLGHAASVTERDSFGCGSHVEIVRTFLLYHHRHYTVAKVSTVKHQNRIVDACRFSRQRPVAVRAAYPLPNSVCIPQTPTVRVLGTDPPLIHLASRDACGVTTLSDVTYIASIQGHLGCVAAPLVTKPEYNATHTYYRWLTMHKLDCFDNYDLFVGFTYGPWTPVT